MEDNENEKEEEKVKFQGRGMDPLLVPYHKEMQKKEEFYFMKCSKDKFVKYNDELKEKNNYFSRSKIAEISRRDIEIQNEFAKQKLKVINKIDTDYCQKCPTHKNHCPHKNPKVDLKSKFSYPLLSNSTYGWLNPIDSFKEKHNLNSATRGFYDQTHL